MNEDKTKKCPYRKKVIKYGSKATIPSIDEYSRNYDFEKEIFEDCLCEKCMKFKDNNCTRN